MQRSGSHLDTVNRYPRECARQACSRRLSDAPGEARKILDEGPELAAMEDEQRCLGRRDDVGAPGTVRRRQEDGSETAPRAQTDDVRAVDTDRGFAFDDDDELPVRTAVA